MIRTVRIPPLAANRIGQASTITYIASTCTRTDPATGLCIADAYLPDPSNYGGLPDDPGSGDAVAEWQASQQGIQNSKILNAAEQPAAFVLAQSLFSGTIPSPLPGLGVATPKVPVLQCFAAAKLNGTSWLKCIPTWAWILAGVGGVLLIQSPGRSSR